MNRHPSSTNRRPTRVAITTVAGALTLTTAAAAVAAPASASPAELVPAVSGVVTCQGLGPLLGAGGYLRQQESTTVDGVGRAHVRFSITADDVTLVGADGSRYRLVGAGYDHVVYPGRDITGNAVSEEEGFQFDVIGADGVVGIVRFRLRIRNGESPHIDDTSTCQLPDMS